MMLPTPDMYLSIFADGLMVIAALAAAIYCVVLGRRLKRFNNHETGMGGAIAVLSAQVDDLTKTLASAEATAKKAADELSDLTQRSDAGGKRLEMLLASLHDLPDPQSAEEKPDEPPAKFFRSEPDFPMREAAE